MLTQRDRFALMYIVESARSALQHLGDLTDEQYYASPLHQDAIFWRMSVIGEAAWRVSDATRTATPQIPWRLIRGMRNRLVHDYDNIRLDIVLNTCRNDLQPLIEAVESALQGDAPNTEPS